MGALVFTGVGASRAALAVTAVAGVWVHRLNVGLIYIIYGKLL